MEKKLTKREMILDAALTLFSEKGYDGVGVDEIGEAVGLKGPALYYYFKGKEAILAGVLEAVDAHYTAHFGSAERLTNLPDTLEGFISETLRRLDFTIHDPVVKKARRLLVMEQFRNPQLREQTTRHQITGVEALNCGIITALIGKGLLKPLDPQLLAFEFTAPITMMVQLIDREPEREAWAMERIRQHMRLFCEVYGTGKTEVNQ